MITLFSANEKSSRGTADYLKLGFTGFCMGIADVIPGVSGGTIAFMFGIYEELIASLRSFDLGFLRFLARGKFAAAFDQINWKFLVSVLGGILSAIFLFAKLMSWLLSNHPVLVNAFFFGLILGTVPVIARNLKKWSGAMYSLLAVSSLAMYWFVGMVPLQTPDSMVFLFLCGAVAICAMILPGISGAFILVLLGKYQFIINAVSHHQFNILAVVGCGCAAGILTFVRLLHWLLTRFHDLTVVILTGLVIGSLRKIWPWKEVLQSITSSHGKVIPIEQMNVLPPALNSETLFATGLICAGFILALFIGKESPRSIIKAT